MNAPTRVRYPSKAKVRAAVEVARELGLDVGGFEVRPDGAIRILERSETISAPQSDFDRLQDLL